jgi:hypothetical protein
MSDSLLQCQANPVESELITDADGKFKFENVNPGSYEITLERNGFVSPNHQPGHYSSPISLVAGQKLDGLVFRIESASAITGKIADEDGDPVQGAVVTVSRTFAGVPTTDSLQNTTNDRFAFQVSRRVSTWFGLLLIVIPHLAGRMFRSK